ncbi:fumarylacetoacetate hydrolase family protein [Algihabitans albus]|uniref:fumarylacetoacetate hydrolase family protein n=1 Tax=Algihabitans albus TaxID=2164067 RepID=UPI0013C31B81|nr:fumarylacetoacetate hydrolase family protein [Algihabitans albus]
MRTPATQSWALLGTAAASEQVWGLRQIEFPCGYNIPAGAFAAPDHPLEKPRPDGSYWAMGGFALEVGRGGKRIPRDTAEQHVAGYRPWICVFHDALLDELAARTHTIEMWDRGVSIFYGLWREATHSLGELIPATALADVRTAETRLVTDAGEAQGEAMEAYAYGAEAVLPFMSDFMTLSSGDIYVLGPLVALQVPGTTSQLTLYSGEISHTSAVA